jgi:3alpha(or 20beta)-hydroxysteroid dehydrogenase
MGRLEGKVAIVTGAARGMGAAHARRLVAEGASVVVADTLDDEGGKVASQLGRHALYLHLDVRLETDWKRAVDRTVEQFGRIDILVNNAGVQRLAPVMEMPTEDFRLIFEVNLFGPWLGMRAVIPNMTAAGTGSIINIASVNGLFGAPALSAYAGAKHGVLGLTKSVAMELGATGVRVNAVCPGAIDTPMAALTNELAGFDASAAISKRIPLGRLGRADEMTGIVVFLASDDSSYCTGGVHIVDGGLSSGISLA